MKIQFVKPCWVIKKIESGGFDSEEKVKAIFIEDKPFEIEKINKDKNLQASDIFVENIGGCGGESIWLINVPNGMFKIINDEYPIKYAIDEHFCTNCNDYTLHKCIYSTHERDSSGDHFICNICKWEYSGYSGIYSKPSREKDE